MSKIVCTVCGSDEVTADASARWDEDGDCWVLVGVHDSRWCDVCDSQCDTKLVEDEDG